jgi:hypothetical protein
MNTSKSIRANFGREFILTLTSSAYGTTNPSPGSHSYAEGTDVTIEAIPAAHSRFVRWSGNVPSGMTETNPLIITMNRDKSINAYFERIIYIPQGFSGEKVLNQSLSQDQYINILRWRRNPSNRNISKYRIYVLEGDNLNLVVELDANTFEYWHTNVEGDRAYTYALVAVDDENREGEKAFTTVL